MADKWFEPGVLDELGCRQDDGSGQQGRAPTEFVSCELIPDAAGDASHRCFFYYEGGGYSLFVGDLGRGYRGLSVAFVVD